MSCQDRLFRSTVSTVSELPSSAEQSSVRWEVRAPLDFIDGVFSGEQETLPGNEDSFHPDEVFMGPVLDLNDASITGDERQFVERWMEKKLGTSLSDAQIKQTLQSADGVATVVLYAPVIGDEDNPYYFSQWQDATEGSSPSYILWQEGMYDNLVEEDGYSVMESDHQ